MLQFYCTFEIFRFKCFLIYFPVILIRFSGILNFCGILNVFLIFFASFLIFFHYSCVFYSIWFFKIWRFQGFLIFLSGNFPLVFFFPTSWFSLWEFSEHFLLYFFSTLCKFYRLRFLSFRAFWFIFLTILSRPSNFFPGILNLFSVSLIFYFGFTVFPRCLNLIL